MEKTKAFCSKRKEISLNLYKTGEGLDCPIELIQNKKDGEGLDCGPEKHQAAKNLEL